MTAPRARAAGRIAPLLAALPWGAAFVCAASRAVVQLQGHADPAALPRALGGLGAIAVAAALLSAGLARLLPRRRALATLPGLLALGWLAPAARLPAAPPVEAAPPAPGPDLVLITLDTLRDDHVDTPGGPDTPNLAAFARTATRYRQAVSPAPLTLPAHAAMLTGRAPEDLSVTSNRHRLTVPTLAAELQAAGWRTGAFVGARVLARESGIGAGFDRYDDRWGDDRWSWLWHTAPASRERPGDQVVAGARAWLAQTEGDRRRFLWVHLYDPHSPYGAPGAPPQRAALTPAVKAELADAESVADSIEILSRAERGPQRAAYAEGVVWTDTVLGPLLDALPGDAVVVVAADHGEGLGEHGAWFSRGARLHEPAMRVPLLLRWPGRAAAGADEHRLVSLMDVHPLLRHAAGLDEAPGPLLADPGPRTIPMFTSGERAGRTLRGQPTGPTAGLRWREEKLVADAALSLRWDVAQLEALGYIDPAE